MRSLLKVFLVPIGQIIILVARMRRFLFEQGIWKSVSFDLPTIAIHTIDHQILSNEVLGVLKTELKETIGHSPMFLHGRDTFWDYGFQPKKDVKMFHAIPAVESDIDFTYRHKVLAISELAGLQDNLAVVLPNEKFYSEVRPQVRLLVLRTETLAKFSSWPVGERIVPKNWLRLADVILIDETGGIGFAESKERLHELLGNGVSIFVLKRDSKEKKSDSVDIASQSGIFIDDRDNFGRSIKRAVNQFISVDGSQNP